MQEEILSNRLLFFIDGQVYLQCPRNLYNEALNWGDEPVRGLQHMGSLYSQIFGSESGTDFYDYSAIVMYYMCRNLTFSSDILRAAQGMLRKYSLLSGLHCFEGMTPPLDRSLLFHKLPRRHQEQNGRRAGFQSYAWTGWLHPVMYTPELERFETFVTDFEADIPDGREGMRTWIDWHCRIEGGKLFRISNTGRLERTYAVPTADSAQLRSRKAFRDLPISISDLNIHSIRLTPYPLLIFWTICINLKLVPRDEPLHRDTPTNLIDFDAFDGLDRHCGTVDSDISLPVWTSEGQFILVAADVDGFLALMVKWEDGITERKGVIRLSSHSINYPLPPGLRWKCIVLG
jgi:hypothetical protein